MNESDPRSNLHYLGSSEIRPEKKKKKKKNSGLNFFQALFHYCLSSTNYCEDHFHSQVIFVSFIK